MRLTQVLIYPFLVLSLVLAGCSSAPKRSAESPRTETVTQPIPSTATAEEPSEATAPPGKGGGYYLDDGPGDNPPAALDEIPDALPKTEPLHKYANRPYMVLGKNYTPATQRSPYKAIGLASWYGKKFHGQKTASGEIYDMYGMTAAHPTLPIPSFVCVTQLKTNKSIIVRINDRGPFRRDRLIDLSYTAAHKLGIIRSGSSLVQVETIVPGTKMETMVASAPTKAAEEPPPQETRDEIAPAMEEPIALQQPALEAPIAAATSSNEQGAVYLQLGAFNLRDNAENYLAKLRAELTSLAHTMQIFASDGLFRIHLGPYATLEEAKQISAEIASKINITPLLSVR